MKESELKTDRHNRPIQKSELKTKKQNQLMKESELKMDRHNRPIQNRNLKPRNRIGRWKNRNLKWTDTIARYKNRNLTSTDFIERYNRKIESVSEDRSIGPFAHLWYTVREVETLSHIFPKSGFFLDIGGKAKRRWAGVRWAWFCVSLKRRWGAAH